MIGKSNLEALYVASFGEPPSSYTSATLHTIERVMGVARDDPLAQMLVLQLRVADLTVQRLDDLSSFGTKASAKAENLVSAVHHAMDRLEVVERRVSALLKSAEARGINLHRDPHVVEYDRRISPLVSYLRQAFYWRNGSLEDERISAARWDAFFLVGLCAIIFMAGMALTPTLLAV